MSLFVFSLKAGEFWFHIWKMWGNAHFMDLRYKSNRIYLVIEFYKELEILLFHTIVYFLFHQPELCMGLNLSQPVLGAGGTRRSSSNRAKEVTNTKVPKGAQTSE